MEIHLRLTTVFILFLVVLSVGTISYMHLEQWGLVDSLYFSTFTLTTIGASHLVPSTDASKLFSVVYALVSVIFLLFSVAFLSDYYFNQYRKRK